MARETKVYFDDELKAEFSQVYGASYLKNEPLKFTLVEQGIVMPMTRSNANFHRYEYGVLDADGRYIETSGKYLEPFYDHKLPEQISYLDEEVVFGGYIPGHYGHFLLETTIRLWYYLANRTQGQKLCFFTSLNEIPKFAKDFFELLEINPLDIVLVRGYTRFRNIVVPEPSFVWWQYYTKEFLIPFRKAAEKVVPGVDDCIYLSRRNCDLTAKAFGEDDIETVMNANGYKSVEFQFMTLREQISAIKGAKVVAGINGTAMHNVLFSDTKPDVIIFNRSETPDSQYIINDAVGSGGAVIQAYNNPLRVIHGIGPFIVGITSHVARFCKEHYLTIPRSSTSFDWLPLFLARFIDKYRGKPSLKLLVDEEKFDDDTLEFILEYRKKCCRKLPMLLALLSRCFSVGSLRKHAKQVYEAKKIIHKKADLITSVYEQLQSERTKLN